MTASVVDPGVLVAASAPAFLPGLVAAVIAGAAIAYVCQRIGLVPIVGFLMAGVVIGPNALGVVTDQDTVNAAAEIGVILLLFSIGLEFSLARLAAIRRLILVGGTLQVALAIGVTAAVLLAFGVGWEAALFTGMLVSLSSTAIVLKLLSARGEMRSSQGQAALGLLLFQDLAIVAMVLVVPMLGTGGGSLLELGDAVLRAIVVVAIVIVVARRLMPPILEVVARACSAEVFLAAVVAICFGTAYLTSLAGISVSLGAFLAGLMVSESRFSEHAFGEIRPLEIIFSGVFFVSVGMLLDPAFLLEEPLLVLGAVAGILVIKSVTGTVAVRALGLGAGTAVFTGLMLAQIGEFSFVLEKVGRDAGLTPAGQGADGVQAFIAATVLLMAATPLLAMAGRWFAGRGGRSPEAAADHAERPGPDGFADHAIVGGYGPGAPSVVGALRASGVPVVVTTLNPDGAARVEGLGVTVLRGDATRQATLEHAGLRSARVLVVPDDDPETAARIVAVARTIRADVPVVVRADHGDEVDGLAAAGASHVVAGDRAGINCLAETALQVAGPDEGVRADWPVPPARVLEVMTPDPCAHLDATRPVLPRSPGCEDCMQRGDAWVHLRICMTCGHVGCCDTSPNRHASAHHAATGHPIVRSLEPGEDWAWCYLDRQLLPASGGTAPAPAQDPAPG